MFFMMQHKADRFFMYNNRLQEGGELDSRNTLSSKYAYNPEEIGKTFVSYNHKNIIGSFWFAIKADVIVNPFDYVTVEQQQSNYKTIGMIQDIQTVAAVVDKKQSSEKHKHTNNSIATICSKYNNYQDGINIARVAVMANPLTAATRTLIGMPVGLGKTVRLANADEVMPA